jgi:hypothetical protein
MGSLYRPKYRAADGTQRESAVIWLKYRGCARRTAPRVERDHEGTGSQANLEAA